MKVIRVKNANNGETPIDQDVLEQKHYLVEQEFSDESIYIMFEGKTYEILNGEYETLTDEEVKDLLFKKLEKEGQRLLDLGGPNE